MFCMARVPTFIGQNRIQKHHSAYFYLVYLFKPKSPTPAYIIPHIMRFPHKKRSIALFRERNSFIYLVHKCLKLLVRDVLSYIFSPASVYVPCTQQLPVGLPHHCSPCIIKCWCIIAHKGFCPNFASFVTHCSKKCFHGTFVSFVRDAK